MAIPPRAADRALGLLDRPLLAGRPVGVALVALHKVAWGLALVAVAAGLLVLHSKQITQPFQLLFADELADDPDDDVPDDAVAPTSRDPAGEPARDEARDQPREEPARIELHRTPPFVFRAARGAAAAGGAHGGGRVPRPRVGTQRCVAGLARRRAGGAHAWATAPAPRAVCSTPSSSTAPAGSRAASACLAARGETSTLSVAERHGATRVAEGDRSLVRGLNGAVSSPATSILTKERGLGAGAAYDRAARQLLQTPGRTSAPSTRPPSRQRGSRRAATPT